MAALDRFEFTSEMHFLLMKRVATPPRAWRIRDERRPAARLTIAKGAPSFDERALQPDEDEFRFGTDCYGASSDQPLSAKGLGKWWTH